MGSLVPFSALPAGELSRLAREIPEMEVPAGTLIWGKDDAYRGVCILAAGRVKVSLLSADGREYTIRHLRAPECFGRMEALDEGRYTAYVEALERCRLLTVSRERYLELVKIPAVSMSLLVALARRVRDLTERIEELIWERGDARLVDVLLRLGPCGEKIAISQAELACLVNLSREKLSARLGRLRSERCVEAGRGWIRLCRDPRIPITPEGAC